MGSKPSSQQNTNSNYTPPPQVMQNYAQVTSQAQGVSATPYSAYGGELVSPVNQQQQTGIGAVNSASGIQDDYNTGATGLAAASAENISPTTVNAADISNYESPYQSDVVNATEAEIQNQNQQQAASLQGNSIASGSFGGDRAGVAQAALAGQQDLASNATIANLNNQNYAQALGEANTQQSVGLGAAQNTAARQLAASQQLGTLGSTAQTEALNEANAQTNAGTLEQTTQQAKDTAAYNQFLQQQAYPFETTGWLANIVEGIGSQSGGSSTGQTTNQTSTGSQIAGGVLGLASFLNRGGRVPHRASGGGLGGATILAPNLYDPTAAGGPTGLGGGSFVPQINLPIGHTMPTSTGATTNPAAQTPQQQGQQIGQTAKAVQTLGNAGMGAWNNPAYGGGNALEGDAFGGSGAAPLDGLSAADYGAGFRRGGPVRHYDGGGLVPDDDSVLFDPNAMGGPSVDSALTPAARIEQGFAGASDPGPAPAAAPTAGLASPPIAPSDVPMPVARPTGVASPEPLPMIAGLNPQARGMRNNNPGNLVDNAWTQSLPGYAGTDGRFAVFDTPQQGAAALDHNLQSYAAKGINTPLAIASRWAPAGDGGNDPPAYAGVIAKSLGIGVNDPVDLSDPAQRSRVGAAISLVENGNAPNSSSPGLGSPSALAFDNQQPPSPANSPGLKAIGSALLPGNNGTQTSAPQFPDSTPTPSTGRTGLLGLNLSPETRELMLSAGLGIMGGTSRSALTNIGQGGLAGINQFNANRTTQANIGLKGAQTQQIQTETAIKQQQLNLMMKALEANQKIFAGSQPSVAPSVETPTVTAPTVAPTGNASGAAPNATGAAPQAGAIAPAAPAPTAATQVAPQFDPVRLGQAAETWSVADPQRAQYYRTLQQDVLDGRAQVQFQDGHWGYFNPQAGIDLAAQKAGAESAAGATAKETATPHTVFGPDGTPTLVSGAQYMQLAKDGGGYINGTPVTPEVSPYVKPGVATYEKFITDGTAFSSGYQPARQQLSALADIYSKYVGGRGAEAMADFAGYAKAAGIDLPVNWQTGFDTALKSATQAAFQQLQDNHITRAPASGLRAEMAAVARPDASPEARFKIITDSLAQLDYKNDMYNQIIGSGTHNIPQAVLNFNRTSNYQTYLNRVRAQTPPPAGATPRGAATVTMPGETPPGGSPPGVPTGAVRSTNRRTGAVGWVVNGHVYDANGGMIQ